MFKNRNKRVSFFLFSLMVLVIFLLFIMFKRRNSLKPFWIVYVVVDTLRADHLHCYGYPRNTSPFIDWLAKRGTVFTHAYSHSATTIPSHASMFTSLYPYQHGAYSNRFVLKDKFLTLAEYLNSKGYNTVGVVSVPWMQKLNLNQGYEIFNFPEEENIDTSLKYRPASATVDETIKIIEKEKLYSKRTFLWVHFFDTHIPLMPPEKYVNKLASVDDKRKILEFLLNTQKLQLKPHKNSPEHLYKYVLKYDAEILYVDEELNRLYQFLKKKLGKRKVLWIITSDHGEGLGAHNWMLHAKYIYTELVHVPLLFVWENYNFPPAKFETMVGHVDIFPTIADVLGDNIKEKVKRAKGISLMPLFFGKGETVHRYIFTERERDEKDDILCSLRSKIYSYFYDLNGRDEFYDLMNDPYETVNLIDKKLPVADKFKAMISREVVLLRKAQKGKNKRLKDKKALEQLRSLGYVK